ncbi:FAD-dependent oxidoreductase [Actinoplanes sp. NEAU-H7]|uniref:FAD-dependent oxidoreductase n=1 Tax=Actinoplanes flavus TaxID=2820290 RepID=A0ABS3UJC9_9ACTN|nr:FAD-dependent oxidoreductase [Actinoplanes flavus]
MTTTSYASSVFTRTGYSYPAGSGEVHVDESATVVVVGFGAAGVCAAIEAAEAGADVLVIDRFTGGGATAISGGVVYAGGGTRQQRAAGVTDTPSAMYAYLRHEVGDAVSPATLHRFCDESADMLAWLEDHGVPFDARLCPYKTSYPTNRHYLYQSGSEHAHPDPAPRGHRVHAPGTSGGTLHTRLVAAARTLGVRFLPQTQALSLILTPSPAAASPAAASPAAPPPASSLPAAPPTGSPLPGSSASGPPPLGSPSIEPSGGEPSPTAEPSPGRQAATSAAGADHAERRVVGVECRTLRDAPAWARLAHRRLHRWSVKPGLYLPGFGRAMHRLAARIENRHGRTLRIQAGAVVLAAGGFVFNREMMREHAPGYRGLRLGTPGDDGSGIRLGTAAGAGVRHLGRVTLWRFLTPPSALLGGVLIDRDGHRFCDESRYGAALGDAILHRPGGRAWLLIDATVLAEARRQSRSQTLWFQRLPTWWLLTVKRLRAPTLDRLAGRAGIDPSTLATTVTANNTTAAATGSEADAPIRETLDDDSAVSGAVGYDQVGKPLALVRPLIRPPFSLLDVSLRASPAPMLTLGGLTVDEETGGVLCPDSTEIPGLFAAGRTAVGICSGSYVSGLSLADCVFSGRRAGRAAAMSPRPEPAPKPVPEPNPETTVQHTTADSSDPTRLALSAVSVGFRQPLKPAGLVRSALSAVSTGLRQRLRPATPFRLALSAFLGGLRLLLGSATPFRLALSAFLGWLRQLLKPAGLVRLGSGGWAWRGSKASSRGVRRGARLLRDGGGRAGWGDGTGQWGRTEG